MRAWAGNSPCYWAKRLGGPIAAPITYIDRKKLI